MVIARSLGVVAVAPGGAVALVINVDARCQAAKPARRRSVRRWRNVMTRLLARDLKPSHPVGLEITSVRKNDGHSFAAWATSPHNPHPIQLSMTVATGSCRSGSDEGRTVREGHPESRIQE